MALSPDADSPAGREFAAAKTFFSQARSTRGQKRFEFKVFRRHDVRAALCKLFHGKCAYCESRFSASSHGELEQFRPKASVLENPYHPGYWWLAMSWENMLIACPNCNRTLRDEGVLTGKPNRFPLEHETQRAFHPGEETREKPLLLDPSVDFPESHLLFDANGMVISDTRRGQTTIAVLGLNRPSLVAQRAEAAQALLFQLEEMEKRRPLPTNAQMMEWYEQITDASLEFAALKRQLLHVLKRRLRGPQEAQISRTYSSEENRKRRAKQAFTAFQTSQSSYTLDDEGGRRTYRSQRRMIERIVIKNIKGI
jgi:uncharacterized protein (TIGR02646 family)